MSRVRSTPSDGGSDPAPSSPTLRTVVRRIGVGHVIPGLLGLVGPLVWGNDDDGPVNTAPGLFLGVVAVNGYHSLLHVTVGVLGMIASRDDEAARTYLGATAGLFGVLAVVGWRRFGFERGVHALGPLAVDGWGNVGHTVLCGLLANAFLRTPAEGTDGDQVGDGEEERPQVTPRRSAR